MTTVDYALTTRQKVKDFLSITDTSKDTLIDLLINGVSSAIERYCGGRRFLATDYVEIKDANGKQKLFLDQYPINSVTSVDYRSGTASTPNWNAYNADNYLIYNKQGYIRFYGSMPNVPQGIRVTYNGGYLIDFTDEFDILAHTLPFDITKVATELVAMQTELASSQGITSQTTEGQSVSYDINKNMTSDHKQILSGYKNYNI